MLDLATTSWYWGRGARRPEQDRKKKGKERKGREDGYPCGASYCSSVDFLSWGKLSLLLCFVSLSLSLSLSLSVSGCLDLSPFFCLWFVFFPLNTCNDIALVQNHPSMNDSVWVLFLVLLMCKIHTYMIKLQNQDPWKKNSDHFEKHSSEMQLLILPPSHLLASKWVHTTVFRLFRPGVQSSENKYHIYFCWLRIGISAAATWLGGWQVPWHHFHAHPHFANSQIPKAHRLWVLVVIEELGVVGSTP